MKDSYANKNVAVLGAGLSGTAAANLLRGEGANVTVLDSADESKLLKSTLDNLRSNGVRVVTGSAADSNRDNYDVVVLSPGIDPERSIHVAVLIAHVSRSAVKAFRQPFRDRVA